MELHEKNHTYFMRYALEEAYKSFEAQEVPIGAIIEKDGILGDKTDFFS